MNGQLSTAPLVELLHEIHVGRLSGALRLTRERVKSIVYAEAGKVIYAGDNLRAHRLAACAKRRGLISDAQLQSLGETISDEQFAAAVTRGALLNCDQLAALRRAQTMDALLAPMLWTEGEWKFAAISNIADALNGAARVEIEIAPLLTVAARRLPAPFAAARLSHADEIISPAADLESAAACTEAGAQLTPIEAFVLSRLQEPTSVSTLATLCGLPDETARQAIYALALGGFVKRERAPRRLADAPVSALTNFKTAARNGTETAPAQPSRAVAAEPKVEPPPDPLAQLDELFRRAAAETHYETLGVARDTTGDEIKRAYYALAKRFHPDRFRREADDGLHSRIEGAFARIAQAYETLKDDKSRAAYNLKLRRSAAQNLATAERK